MTVHVAIVGAGALGRVYGARLSEEAGATVSFVVRASAPRGPIQIARVDGKHEEHTVATPEWQEAVPGAAEVVLVCVRAEQIDDALVELLRAGPAVPAVLLTPLFPDDARRLRASLGDRLVVAMPSVVAYAPGQGAVRYWLPRVAHTLLQDGHAVVHDLARALETAGIASRVQSHVLEVNAATTISFLPFTLALATTRSVDALLADDALLELALEAAREAEHVAARVGRPPSWVDLLLRFANPALLRGGVALAERASPEAVRYVEVHFGQKLRAQAVSMGRSLLALATAEGLPHAAITALVERVEERVA
jgi:2-dehydropantoate 2-reductase